MLREDKDIAASLKFEISVEGRIYLFRGKENWVEVPIHRNTNFIKYIFLISSLIFLCTFVSEETGLYMQIFFDRNRGKNRETILIAVT